jgi:hypothetical protein
MINQTEKVSLYVVNQIALENRKSEIEKEENLDEFRTESGGVGVFRSDFGFDGGDEVSTMD